MNISGDQTFSVRTFWPAPVRHFLRPHTHLHLHILSSAPGARPNFKKQFTHVSEKFLASICTKITAPACVSKSITHLIASHLFGHVTFLNKKTKVCNNLKYSVPKCSLPFSFLVDLLLP